MDRHDETSFWTRRDVMGGAAALAALAVLPTTAMAATSPSAPSGEDLCFTSATALAEMIRAKSLSPVELMDAVLARTERINPILRSFLHVDPDGARAAAREAEAAVMRGDSLGPLHGIPVSIKDSHNVKGMPTTNGSLITGGSPAMQDVELVANTRAAGGIVFAKSNLPALAHIDVTENLLGPPCQNPWKLGCNTGGSSGGAGAACAAGLGPLHHGTDGGGSIRIPADRCGVFGLKPSVGRIGHRGALGAAIGTGHDGPMTRTVADAALLLNVWAGPLDADYLSIPTPPEDYVAAVAAWESALKGKRVGVTFDYGWVKAIDPEVRQLVGAAAQRFAELGCRVEEVNPSWPNPLRAFEALWYTTAAGKRALFDGHEAWLDESLRLMMEEGAQISGVELAQAVETKDKMFQLAQAFFADHDLLLSPVCAVPAWATGQDVPMIDGVDASYIGTRLPTFARMPFTPTFNLTGHPAASVPCGFTADGVPVGLQIVGPRHADALVLQAAAGFEAIQPWADRRPPIA
ncbi:amidase family protein [Paracoccus sp. WLY502]|uniref:amidase n=1 Tax=Paracoccus yibinensis TaxID=3068891 RepID=UPI002796967E|nr:amidase family protein [Paracoccus sp. WLY502]MDQ1901631.1 amidase family protein [Paracoccus sp. WLY502]